MMFMKRQTCVVASQLLHVPTSRRRDLQKRALAYHAVQPVVSTRLLPAARVAIASGRCASCSLASPGEHVHLHGLHVCHESKAKGGFQHE